MFFLFSEKTNKRTKFSRNEHKQVALSLLNLDNNKASTSKEVDKNSSAPLLIENKEASTSKEADINPEKLVSIPILNSEMETSGN